MKAFLKVTDTITTELQSHPFVNTVTWGDIFDVDLTKITKFPLAHYIVTQATFDDKVIKLSFNILCMAINGENEKEILAEQLSVLSRLFERLRRGDLWTDAYQLDGIPTPTPFRGRWENDLIGWECNFTIKVLNEMGID